jgi:hypothetical protein
LFRCVSRFSTPGVADGPVPRASAAADSPGRIERRARRAALRRPARSVRNCPPVSRTWTHRALSKSGPRTGGSHFISRPGFRRWRGFKCYFGRSDCTVLASTAAKFQRARHSLLGQYEAQIFFQKGVPSTFDIRGGNRSENSAFFDTRGLVV